MLMADGWRGVALLCRSGRSQLFPESLDLMERNGAQRRDHPFACSSDVCGRLLSSLRPVATLASWIPALFTPQIFELNQKRRAFGGVLFVFFFARPACSHSMYSARSCSTDAKEVEAEIFQKAKISLGLWHLRDVRQVWNRSLMGKFGIDL